MSYLDALLQIVVRLQDARHHLHQNAESLVARYFRFLDAGPRGRMGGTHYLRIRAFRDKDDFIRRMG